jgi:hypothetical protein
MTKASRRDARERSLSEDLSLPCNRTARISPSEDEREEWARRVRAWVEANGSEKPKA